MEPQNNTDSNKSEIESNTNNENDIVNPAQSQEVIDADNAFEKVTEQVRSAASATMFISTINVIIGAALAFIPVHLISEFLDDIPIDTSIGLGYIIFGLIFLLMSIGVYKRSRLCIIIAMLVFAADTAYIFISDDLLNLNIVGTIFRVSILVGLICGFIASLKYHSLVKRHRKSDNSEILAVIDKYKSKMSVLLIVAYIIIGSVGLGAIAYSFMTGGFASGRDFETWTEHHFRDVMVRVPSAHVQEEVERIPEIPGGSIVIATSEIRAAAVSLSAYVGFGDVAGMLNLTVAEFEHTLLESVAEEIGLYITDQSRGNMSGVRYYEIRGVLDTYPAAFRVFTVGDDIYIFSIAVERDSDVELIDSFFDSVVIVR